MATLTKKNGPIVIGEGCKQAIYQLALDSSYAAGGEAIDVSGDFDYVYAGSCEAIDALDDGGYKFDLIIPAPAVAVTSSNVLVCAHVGGTTNQVMEEASGDLSSVGQLSVVIWGA